MTKQDVETRKSAIESVKTPLAFLVLVFLAIDGTIVSLAITLPEYRQILVWAILISMAFLAITVVLMAIFRPEALKGERPLQEIYARNFATELFQALDGSLKNLPKLEREEAWLTLADVITSETTSDSTYKKFCAGVAARIKELTDVKSKRTRTTGTIKR